MATSPDVPPELRPYYNGQSRGMGARRTLARLIPILAILVLAGAVGYGLWRYSQAAEHKPAAPKTNQSTQTARGNNKQNQAPSQSSSSSSKSKQPSSSSSSSTQQNSQSQSSNPYQQPTSTPSPSTQQPTQSQSTPTTPSQTGTTGRQIPNTGPGTDMLLVALAVGLFGALADYVRRAVIARR